MKNCIKYPFAKETLLSWLYEIDRDYVICLFKKTTVDLKLIKGDSCRWLRLVAIKRALKYISVDDIKKGIIANYEDTEEINNKIAILNADKDNLEDEVCNLKKSINCLENSNFKLTEELNKTDNRIVKIIFVSVILNLVLILTNYLF